MPKKEEIKHYINPVPTTDIFIEYEQNGTLGIVLIERKDNNKGIALPGGFAEVYLTYEQNAVKEAKEETGLDIEILNPRYPYVSTKPGRDPRGNMVSNAYVAKGTGTIKAGDDAKNAYFCSIDDVVKLVDDPKIRFAFDHRDIINEFLNVRGYRN